MSAARISVPAEPPTEMPEKIHAAIASAAASTAQATRMRSRNGTERSYPAVPTPETTAYEVAADGSRRAAAAGLLARKSETDATASHSSQTSIVKKMIDRIAQTPAKKPNQLTQRGRIA